MIRKIIDLLTTAFLFVSMAVAVKKEDKWWFERI